MKNIILIGMMGCGKTTVGRLRAQALGRELVDTDEAIERREGRSISDIFAQEGEPYFRDLEAALCQELAQRDGLAVACGGGLPLRDACMEGLAPGGVVFWLDRDPGETYDSLDTSGRPLAQAGREAFLRRYEQRAPTYRRWADHIISQAASPEAAARSILQILQREAHVL